MDIREATKFGFREYLVSDNPHIHLDHLSAELGIDFRRLLFQFPNGYSASVIRIPGSYGSDSGLWEVAVIYEDKLVYDTPVTGDVLGSVDIQEVHETLEKIYNLPIRMIK